MRGIILILDNDDDYFDINYVEFGINWNYLSCVCSMLIFSQPFVLFAYNVRLKGG